MTKDKLKETILLAVEADMSFMTKAELLEFMEYILKHPAKVIV